MKLKLTRNSELSTEHSTRPVASFFSEATMGAAPSSPKLEVIRVKRGEDIAFRWTANCGVYGTWKKGGQELVAGGRIRISHSEDYTHFYLTITGARGQDEGQYTLELKNFWGKASGSANVELLEYDSDWRRLDCDAATVHRQNERMRRTLRVFPISNPEVRQLRFLLHGITSYGKSSIINSIMTVFKQRRVITLVPTASHAIRSSHTRVFRSYAIEDRQNKRLPFVFSDTMGVEFQEGGVLAADIISALKGHVMDGYEFNTESPLVEGHPKYNPDPSLNDQFHCLVTVVDACQSPALNDFSGCKCCRPECEKCSIALKMTDVRNAIGDIPQVVLLTHVDEWCPLVNADLKHIYSSKAVKQAMKRCSNALGVPMTCIFPVKNYHEENAVDSKMDCLILDALEKIVHFANDYVQSRIQ